MVMDLIAVGNEQKFSDDSGSYCKTSLISNRVINKRDENVIINLIY
jgi:hypothetical protein